MATKGLGGLGVGILYDFNRAMMFKWRWRFFHDVELLWVTVVKIIYGADGCLSSLSPCGSCLGLWNNLIHMLTNLRNVGLIFLLYAMLGWEMELLRAFGMKNG